MSSKRELKAAQIKYSALEYVLEESRSRNFEDIYVVELCKQIGISKVTFFKYFKSKEDLLLYYKSILTLQIIISLVQNQLEGMAALQSIVKQFASEYAARPSMVLGLIHYYTTSIKYVSPMRVKPAERSLFFPEAESVEYEMTSLDELIEQQMLDVVFKKQTTLSTNSKLLSELFLSTLFGAILVCRMKKKENASMFLFQMLATLFPDIRK